MEVRDVWMRVMCVLSLFQGDFSAKWLLLALQSLTTPTHPKREMVAIRSLLIAHHPDIGIPHPPQLGHMILT